MLRSGLRHQPLRTLRRKARFHLVFAPCLDVRATMEDPVQCTANRVADLHRSYWPRFGTHRILRRLYGCRRSIPDVRRPRAGQVRQAHFETQCLPRATWPSPVSAPHRAPIPMLRVRDRPLNYTRLSLHPPPKWPAQWPYQRDRCRVLR